MLAKIDSYELSMRSRLGFVTPWLSFVAPECKTSAGLYAGAAYRPECFEWSELLENEEPVFQLIGSINNFPDGNHQMAGNKCR